MVASALVLLLVALVAVILLLFALLWLSQAEVLLATNTDLLTTLVVQLQLELMPSLLEIVQVNDD